jgi:opacity protein-like surface antigen
MKNSNLIRITISIVILTGAGLTSPLFAASVSWVGADVMQWSYNPDEVDKLGATTGKIRGGIEYSDYFGVETHFTMGGSDTVVVQDTEVNVDLDYMWGVFVRASYPISAAKLYGIFGASNLMMSIDSDVLSGVDRITRLSYGAGAEYLINDNWVINADYIVYLKSESFTFSGISAGLRYRFH